MIRTRSSWVRKHECNLCAVPPSPPKVDAITDLRAEPHLAVADDAGEGELAAVGGHVLLQPTPGAGDHVEDLAAVPQAPERALKLRFPDL